MFLDLNPNDFQNGIDTIENLELIDCRTAEEFQSGHLPNALNFDILNGDFQSQIPNFSKDKTYYIYCRSGARSTNACQMLLAKGIENVANLQGGILGWNGPKVQ